MMLFLRYAFVCAEDRLRAHKITQKDYERLLRMLAESEEIDTAFLSHCFPDATAGLRKFAKDRHFENMWAFDVVAEYWRHHHGKHGYCAVSAGVIVHTAFKNKIVGIEISGRRAPFINEYGLVLTDGQQVFVHRHSVIEVL
ncbi:MAG: hypothetical protein WCK48_00360 [bacterium]